MARTCSVCGSPNRAGIDKAALEAVPYRTIARRFEVGKDAVSRHVANGHVPLELVARQEDREAVRGQSLTARAEHLWQRASAILAEAEGRPTVQLAAVRELRGIVELLGRLTGGFAVAEDTPIRIKLTLDDGGPVGGYRPWPPLHALPEGEGTDDG